MKVQLLQDIDDSGGVPAPAGGSGPLPPARPRPAIWHRAQDGPDQTMPQRPVQPIEQPVHAAGTDLPPDVRLEQAPASLPDPLPDPLRDPVQAPLQDPANFTEPDWLAELMRQDAARAEAQHKAGLWKRRVLGWSLAGATLALVAGGGLWLAEERRVDGALVVVAETKPPPVPMAAAAAAMPAPLTVPLTVPAQPALAEPAPVLASPRPPPTILEEAVPAEPAEVIRRPHGLAKGTAKIPGERGLSERQKREETLLQCRALGYDERQCIRQGCGMTRFGLACRGES